MIAKQVRTHTTSGDVTFAGAILDATAATSSTRTRATSASCCRPDVGAQLSVSTFNGSHRQRLPDHAAAPASTASAQRRRSGSTSPSGSGSARIIAETFSGDITLRPPRVAARRDRTIQETRDAATPHPGPRRCCSWRRPRSRAGPPDRSDAFTLNERVPAGQWIRVRNVNGDLRVRPSTSDRVEITATKTWRRGDPKDVRIES